MEELELKNGTIVDEFDDGAMLMIWKAFNEQGTRWYKFAAIKAGNKWYVTGQDSPRYGLDTSQFVTWILRGSRLAPMPRLFWARYVDEL